MPVLNREDAVDVDEYIETIFQASENQRAEAIRKLFVEKLDFEPVAGYIGLGAAPQAVSLPHQCERIASLSGVNVVYVPLNIAETNRVRKSEASEAARLIFDQLSGDMVLVMTNTMSTQLHFIYPTFQGARPSLKRMVIERNLPRRTAVQQLSNIYWHWQDTGNILQAIERTFDVDAVTERFFGEYRRIFDRVMNQVQGFGTGENEVEAKKLFVQTMFNRLMFVYFVSRKGWLSFKGNSDYLNAMWADYPCQIEDKNFYANRLKALFFAGLNNPRSVDLVTDNPAMHALIGDVKFLNGGLFEETQEDGRPGIIVPDQAIGIILDELLNRFNFTVMESTPFDTEVAVDPEMLGKVFEELVTGRHDKGSYYTPRPVVSYMCREALMDFLQNKDTGASAEAIREFVDNKDTSLLTASDAPRVGAALSEVTVVDPACGSGAYLIGMLQELVDLSGALYSAHLSQETQDLYELKLRIIEQNLYGVDNDQFAVNISMLRLWLSLAIEFDGESPPPLPNLDFKIVSGDSLTGPDPSVNNLGDLFTYRIHELAQILGRLKKEHLRSIGIEKSRTLTKIEELQHDIAEEISNSQKLESSIDWRSEFGEVFGISGGFDIVIANPPYGISVHGRRADLIRVSDSYTSFMLLATEIAQRGVLAYITPTSWQTGEGFARFRKILIERASIRVVINLPYDVFATPYVDTVITVASVGKGPPKSFRLATLGKREDLDLNNLNEHLEQIDWAEISNDANLKIPLARSASSMFSRLSVNSKTLGELVHSRRGIEAYRYHILDRPTEDSLPYFTGQIRRYAVADSSDMKFVTVGPRDARFQTGVRILTRRIVSRSNRLMSALVTETFVVKKDLYVLMMKEHDQAKLTMLSAILNSSLISFLYLSRSAAATKDDFRQVTLAGLRELPIIFPEGHLEGDLIHLVSKLSQREPGMEPLDQKVDDIVFDCYGISSAERDFILDWLAQPG